MIRPQAVRRLGEQHGRRVACTAAAMRGKVGSEFETKISYNAQMHFRHRQTDRQTDTDIVA